MIVHKRVVNKAASELDIKTHQHFMHVKQFLSDRKAEDRKQEDCREQRR